MMNHKSASGNELKTYSRLDNKTPKIAIEETKEEDEKVSLTTLKAVQYLLEGTLRLRVCRYCLNVTSDLSELDEVLTVAVNGALHEVTIRDIVASFHPYKVAEDPNFPNKICKKCVDQGIRCYLFTQQCEQAERALLNCFNDIYEKYEKLDPLEPAKKRGKRKLHPNPNAIQAEHQNVINYAEPLINIVNVTSNNSDIENNDKINELECQKCWQVLPNVESLLNHENSHPKSMWFNCRLCGKSFVKRSQIRKHIKEAHKYIQDDPEEIKVDDFKCNECGFTSKSLAEHLLHNEKHKFKSFFKCLVERKVDLLCTVCLDKGTRLMSLKDVIHLHGGYTGLTGEKSIEHILTATIPGINLDTYTGTKICDKCYNHALSSYIFIVKIQYVRSRLNTCVSGMLDRLSGIDDTDKNLMVEVSQDTILPKFNLEEIIDDDLKVEDEHKVDVLEDEFRISESESNVSDELDDTPLYNPAKNITKTYTKKKLFNGYRRNCEDTIFRDACSEFLTFRKKDERPKYTPKYRYTCPFCDKHFISDYFLKKHILKHVHRNVQCDVCRVHFKSKFYLFEHRKIHHVLKVKNFMSCEVCGRTFLSAKKMKSHQKSHRIKECQLCDKSFISQKHYDVHIQRHAGKFNSYKNGYVQTCSFCEKACSNENELSLHVNKVHLQIKPYGCDMCDRQFYTETNLSSHKRLHSLFSKEVCAFCSKTFKCRKSLVVHVRKHIGMRPHVCPGCRHAFYSDSTLKRHMRIFHGGIYSCRLCRTVLPSQLDLKSHINLMHNSM